MRVKLISATPNPIDVMYVSARTCYSAKSPIDLWEELPKKTRSKKKNQEIEDKKWNLVGKVLGSGHSSIAENVTMTFAIEGVSRACANQLTRHRAGIVYAQQSQRYVEIKEDYNELVDIWNLIESGVDSLEASEAINKAIKVAHQYFVIPENSALGVKSYFWNLLEYLKAVKLGAAPEDARMILPNATKTNLTTTVNLRELMHVSNLRLCNRAQLEIRQLFRAIRKEVADNYDLRLAGLLMPSCDLHGICFEEKCCGRRQSVKQVNDVLEAGSKLIKEKVNRARDMK